jgi:hypothetical protein
MWCGLVCVFFLFSKLQSQWDWRHEQVKYPTGMHNGTLVKQTVKKKKKWRESYTPPCSYYAWLNDENAKTSGHRKNKEKRIRNSFFNIPCIYILLRRIINNDRDSYFRLTYQTNISQYHTKEARGKAEFIREIHARIDKRSCTAKPLRHYLIKTERANKLRYAILWYRVRGEGKTK